MTTIVKMLHTYTGLVHPGFLFDFPLPNKLILRNTFSILLAYFLWEVKFTEPIQLVTCPIGFLFLLIVLPSKPYGLGLTEVSSFFFEMFCSWRFLFRVISSCSRFWILKLVDSYSFLENSDFCIVKSFCSKKLRGRLPVSPPSIYGLSPRFWLLEFGNLELERLPENSPQCVYLNESEHSLKAWCVLSCWTKSACTINRSGINSFWTASMHTSCDSFWQLRFLHTIPFSSCDNSGCTWSTHTHKMYQVLLGLV